MPHVIVFNPVLRAVEATMDGAVDIREAREIFSLVIQILKEQDAFLYLADYRNAKLTFSTLDLYELPKILAEMAAEAGIEIRRLRRAMVVAKDLEDFQFYENVVINSGQTARMFFDMDEAREWLAGK